MRAWPLPWRGPGPGRPDDLPLRPEGRCAQGGNTQALALPRCLRRRGDGLRRPGQGRARDADVLGRLGPRARIGSPSGPSTRFPVPAARCGARTARASESTSLPTSGSLIRIEAQHPEAGEVRGFLRTGSGTWAESVCPNGEDGFVWTRKRSCRSTSTSGSATAAFAARRPGSRTSPPAITPATRSGAGPPESGPSPTAARSAGTWSRASTTRPSAPSARSGSTASRSSRRRSSFDGLETIAFDDGSRLEFAAEAERVANEKRGPVSYSYRQPFGTFTGTLPGGLELEHGLGVMEHHDALW